MIADRGDSSFDPATARPTGLAQAEARVEGHSASLKKELGVRDLTLTQILFIVGLTWIGVAGKLGPPHVVFWLLALVLFYLPSAAVVIQYGAIVRPGSGAVIPRPAEKIRAAPGMGIARMSNAAASVSCPMLKAALTP